MSDFLLSQILIGIAICTDTISFQFKERKKIVACLLVSCTLISAHFMLLGHWTAAFLGLIAALRFTTSLFSTSKKLMVLFIVANIVISISHLCWTTVHPRLCRRPFRDCRLIL